MGKSIPTGKKEKRRAQNSVLCGCLFFALLVRMTGLEPVRAFTHKHLKLASLPIPAHPQISIHDYTCFAPICQPFLFLSFFEENCWQCILIVVLYCLRRNEGYSFDTIWCTSGGIGRLAGFRCQCSQGRAGSTPASCTRNEHTKVCSFFLFLYMF